jgi:hypothetical protein
MKYILTLLLAFIVTQSLLAQRFDWATTGGAAGVANSFGGALAIAQDPQGNIYTLDYGNHAQQCQGDTLQKITGTTAYIYKFNSQGELLFMNRVGAVGGSFTPFNIVTDDAGSLYLLGQGVGNGFIIVHEDTVPSIDFTNQLIKMDSLGNFVWKQNTGVATNYDGCMLQYSKGNLYYQSGNLSVSKIDTAGVVGANLKASYYTSPTSSTGLLFKGSGVYPNGDLLFAAYSRGTVAYGTDTLFHIGNPFLTAPFLFVRCDTSMKLIWARYASNGRDPDNRFIPVTIDSSDNLYAAVQVNQKMIIGNDTIQSSAFTGQGTIIKLDGAGTGIWAHALQSTGLAYAWCMQNAPDNSGIFIGGGYTGTTQFGSFTLSAANLRKPFIAKFDFNGNYTNAFNYLQDPLQTDALCISADGKGNYCVGGKLPNKAVTVFSCITAPGNVGFYLGKFSEQPDSVPTPSITANEAQLTATPLFSGNIQWYFNGNILNGQTGQTITATQSGDYSVVYSYTSGCADSVSSPIKKISIASVNSNADNQIVSVFPNPSFGLFQIIGIEPNATSVSVSVKGLVGNTIYNVPEFNINQMVDIQEAPQGLYFVEVKYDNNSFIFKIVKM